MKVEKPSPGSNPFGRNPLGASPRGDLPEPSQSEPHPAHPPDPDAGVATDRRIVVHWNTEERIDSCSICEQGLERPLGPELVVLSPTRPPVCVPCGLRLAPAFALWVEDFRQKRSTASE